MTNSVRRRTLVQPPFRLSLRLQTGPVPRAPRCAGARKATVEERKLAPATDRHATRGAHPGRYHEPSRLTGCSRRRVLRCSKHRCARPARAPLVFRSIRDASARARRAHTAQRRVSWRLRYLEGYDTHRAAPVGTCRDAERREDGSARSRACNRVSGTAARGGRGRELAQSACLRRGSHLAHEVSAAAAVPLAPSK